MSKDRIVLLTQNKHKLAELTPLFEEYGVPFETTTLEKFEIRSHNVEEIALAAAKHAYATLGKPVVLDDTGFFVPALTMVAHFSIRRDQTANLLAYFFHRTVGFGSAQPSGQQIQNFPVGLCRAGRRHYR